MATAFTAEAIVGGLLVIIPLLSTGVIAVSARVPSYKPILRVTVEPVAQVPSSERSGASGPTSSAPSSTVVTLGGGNPRICLTCIVTPKTGGEGPPYSPYVGNVGLPHDLVDNYGPNVKPSGPKRIISQLAEGQLVNRVEPVYPHIAAISGIQGQVKLHAIIGRDGKIQSLSAISGHPLLLRAALEAVEQWRYRPYILNGEAVEVETLITVNFKKEMH
jgi:TonB family protein